MVRVAADHAMATRLRFLQGLSQVLSIYVDKTTRIALFSARISRFNDICIAHGYEVAAVLTDLIEDRLKEIFRGDDLVQRISESAFCMIATNMLNTGHAVVAAAKICREFSRPFEIDGRRLYIKLYVGVALSRGKSETATALMRHADIAMALAKRSLDGYAVYEHDESNGGTPWIIEEELQQALENDQLEVYLQPQIDLHTRAIKGAEALTRWLGTASAYSRPDMFIPVVEKSDLIVPFTTWNLNSALQHCVLIREVVPSFEVSVNISPSLLYDKNIVPQVSDALALWGVPPEKLKLEVTETAMMLNPVQSIDTLNLLKETGVLISVDDFGTGYSSLAYLKNMPVDELKIDKSFVANMVRDRGDERIVRSVIDLAHNFGLSVVAEGVGDKNTMDKLTDMGCDVSQGYYTGKPMSVTDFITWARQSEWVSE